MATEVKLPRLGQGMESGTIVRWLKAEGDSVKKREPLYELDTDKVTQEVESDLDGSCSKSSSRKARSRSARRSHDRKRLPRCPTDSRTPESASRYRSGAGLLSAEAPDNTAAADAPPTPPDTS